MLRRKGDATRPRVVIPVQGKQSLGTGETGPQVAQGGRGYKGHWEPFAGRVVRPSKTLGSGKERDHGIFPPGSHRVSTGPHAGRKDPGPDGGRTIRPRRGLSSRSDGRTPGFRIPGQSRAQSGQPRGRIHRPWHSRHARARPGR
ncbi:MAG: hypothetical protein US95_C0010G0026 [Candidatus Woesebacteria bacterium GW2011_GWB1_38_5]|uniref:Uncharacterized protein n=1 Tax=Candidatus Woesebacteria bacterium GW2011_GWB1_38_5 TaxID=1618568 RepID=A0A0G0MN79_9BACT|nr:MAG: hypothetical protein US95_C0010G0026 [Candidatus Woesebacteria bacterium GW2011_GWB1_38_5]